MSISSTCDDCGTEVSTDNERVFIDPNTYCLDCFDATCERCGYDIVEKEERQKKFGTYYCKECAERLCADCGAYIENIEDRTVIHGVIRCEKHTRCYIDDWCCGCGNDVSDSPEAVKLEGGHRFCGECKEELPDDPEEQQQHQQYPGNPDPDESGAPF